MLSSISSTSPSTAFPQARDIFRPITFHLVVGHDPLVVVATRAQSVADPVATPENIDPHKVVAAGAPSARDLAALVLGAALNVRTTGTVAGFAAAAIGVAFTGGDAHA